MNIYILKIVSVLNRSRLLHSMIHWVSYKNEQRMSAKSLKNFHRYGTEALDRFCSCLEAYGYQYSLMFGTLLGAVREHDFIAHDDDIDVGMWIDDFSPSLIDQLKQYEVKLKCSFSVDNDDFAKELTFEYKGVLIDIFFFYRIPSDKRKSYCCYFCPFPDCCSKIELSLSNYGGLMPRKMYIPFCESTVPYLMNGVNTRIPSNYDEILRYRYGDDYLTPKPGWKGLRESEIDIMDKLAIYKEY